MPRRGKFFLAIKWQITRRWVLISPDSLTSVIENLSIYCSVTCSVWISSRKSWRDSTGHRSRERRHCCVGGRVNRHRVPLTGGGELVKVASECISVRLYPCFYYVFQYKLSEYKKISYMTSFFRLFSKFVRYFFTVLLTECPIDTFWCRRVTHVIYITCYMYTHTYTQTHRERGEF